MISDPWKNAPHGCEKGIKEVCVNDSRNEGVLWGE